MCCFEGGKELIDIKGTTISSSPLMHITARRISPQRFSSWAQHPAAGWHSWDYLKPSQGLAQGSCSIISSPITCETIAGGDSSLFRPIVPPGGWKYLFSLSLPVCSVWAFSDLSWGRTRAVSVLRQELGVLLTYFCLFLPFRVLGPATSPGPADPASFEVSSRCWGVDEDVCAAQQSQSWLFQSCWQESYLQKAIKGT